MGKFIGLSAAVLLVTILAPSGAARADGERAARLVANGDGTYTYDWLTFRIDVDEDGTAHIHDKPSLQWGVVGAASDGTLGLGATFDLTDWLMRLHGDDPYLFEKKRFLEETFDMRAELRGRAGARRMRAALDDLPALLDGVWHSRLPADERRRILFYLWDECAEPDDAGGNALVAEGGAEARGLIERWVRERLPPGSPGAFAPEELGRLNGVRASRSAFAPYPEVRVSACAAAAGPLGPSRCGPRA